MLSHQWSIRRRRLNNLWGSVKVYTFSISETEVKEAPSRTSGAVKARKSCWVTYSSVNEMLPEGMSRRDQGEMMKPMAEGSGEGNRHFDHDQEQKQHNLNTRPLFHMHIHSHIKYCVFGLDTSIKFYLSIYSLNAATVDKSNHSGCFSLRLWRLWKLKMIEVNKNTCCFLSLQENNCWGIEAERNGYTA